MGKNLKINKVMLPSPSEPKEGFDSNGFYWCRMSSDLMEPTIKRSSMLCFKPSSLDALIPGDVCMLVHVDKDKNVANRLVCRFMEYAKGSHVTVAYDRDLTFKLQYRPADFSAVFKIVFEGNEIGN